MIRNVVFDFGGVVVGYDPEGYMKKLYGDGPAGRYILDGLFGSELWRDLDLGLVTRREAYAPILERADAAGFGSEMRFVMDHWFEDMMGTREDTVALARRLRDRGTHVFYLTNMQGDVWEKLIARGLRDIFEGGITSFEARMTKPDIRIYRRLLSKLRIRPEETVFFDDMERNVAGARAAGIRGELFTDAGSAEDTLRALGVFEE